jgi:pimeloyl-ACP methyl ester carboxylesterase
LAYLNERGYRRIILIGHSLGAIKSIIYQGTRRRADIVGIVSCSAPRQFYSERVARQAGFREVIEKAEAMIAEGKGEELIPVGVGSTPGIFTARAHVNKYGRDDNNDCRPYAKHLGCPLLAIVGSAEPKFFYEYAQEIVAGVGAKGVCKLVDGANHFYNRHTSQMIEVIYQWLTQFSR